MTNCTIEAAIDAQSKAFLRMPLIPKILHNLESDGFRFGTNVMLFGSQHMMDQALVLCGALQELGIPYSNMFLVGKPYSTNPDTYDFLRTLGINLPRPRRYNLNSSQTAEQITELEEMSALVRSRKAKVANPLILVLDDGGHALTGIQSWLPQPYRIFGVEQTASGFRQPGSTSLNFPVVDVGASAVKRKCEPAMIIDATLRCVDNVLTKLSGKQIGIIGLGYIGEALYNALANRGIRLTVFDEREDALSLIANHHRSRSIFDVFNDSDIIFGCTGGDITRNLVSDPEGSKLSCKSRALISLSSGDDEFFTLKARLLWDNKVSTYSCKDVPDIEGCFRDSHFRILRNGFPINFDNTSESVPLEEIQGTIAALIAALCQASSLDSDYSIPSRVTLDVSFQLWLFSHWRRYLSKPLDIESMSPKLAEELSEPRFEPRSITVPSPFGAWTADRDPSPR